MASPAGSRKSGNLAAVAVAGGRAGRLGGAVKPGVEILGRTMLASVVSAAIGAGACLVVIVGPPRPELVAELLDGGPQPAGAAGVSIEFTSEQPPGAGPVPAPRAGLDPITHPPLGLLAPAPPF